MLPEDKNIWSRETGKTRWLACVNTTGTGHVDALAFNSLFLSYYVFYLLSSANQGSSTELRIDFIQLFQENLSVFTILPILGAVITQQMSFILHSQVRVVTLMDDSTTLTPQNSLHKSQQEVPIGSACGAHGVSYAC